MSALRVFFVGGIIAYRALFNWIRPSIYIPTMLGSPLFQILFFAHLGRFSGVADDAFFVVGNAVQASAMASIYGMTMGIANHPGSAPPGLACVVVITVASCTGFGLLLGSIGLRARDVFFISNLFYFLMLLLCGVNVPLDALPGSLAVVGRALPLTHGIEAARAVAAGAPLRAVDHLIGQEALVGAAYGVAAYALLRLFEAEGRRRATLETM